MVRGLKASTRLPAFEKKMKALLQPAAWGFTAGGIVHHMDSLINTEMLHDEPINAVIGVVIERIAELVDHGWPPVHITNTFFATLLTNVEAKRGRGGRLIISLHSPADIQYERVKQWGQPNNLASQGYSHRCILNCGKVLIPINIPGFHWALVEIDIAGRIVRFFDSADAAIRPATKYALMDCMLYWVLLEARTRGRNDIIALQPLAWAKLIERAPQQLNGVDCGVCMLHNILYRALNMKLLASYDSQTYLDGVRKALVLALSVPSIASSTYGNMKLVV